MTVPGDVAPAFGRRVVAVLRSRWVAIVLMVAAVAFIAQNRDRVSIDVFWLRVLAPLWLLLFLAVVVGVLIGVSTVRRSRPQ